MSSSPAWHISPCAAVMLTLLTVGGDLCFCSSSAVLFTFTDPGITLDDSLLMTDLSQCVIMSTLLVVISDDLFLLIFIKNNAPLAVWILTSYTIDNLFLVSSSWLFSPCNIYPLLSIVVMLNKLK